MTPKQQYYKNIADTMISNLKKRGFEADYVPDRQAALRAIAPYLTKGNTVSCGGSITLTEIGFNTAVKESFLTVQSPRPRKKKMLSIPKLQSAIITS